MRRVTDMTNPEHRLWSQFLTLCAEARGLQAMTEQELLLALNRDMKPEQSPVQGLLHVTARSAGKRQHLTNERDFPVPSAARICAERHQSATMGSAISHQHACFIGRGSP